MSTLPNKKMSSAHKQKHDLLEKIAKQRAAQKIQMFTIPKIKKKASNMKKTFVPNKKTISGNIVYEDAMRDFLTKVNMLTDEDFVLNNDTEDYDNIIVNTGFKLYISEYKDIDTKTLVDQWENNLDKSSKLFWVLRGYGYKQNAEWGRKQFIDDVIKNVKNDIILRQFIDDYLTRGILYNKYVEHWVSQKGNINKIDEIENEETKEEIEKSDTHYKRQNVSEEDIKKINDLKDRLRGYEEAQIQIKNKSEIRETFLQNLSHKDLVGIAIPIMGDKTTSNLINTIIRMEYNKEKGYDRDQRVIELESMDRNDLMIDATTNKNNKQLIHLIIYNEFNRNLKKIGDKIFNINLQIYNLNLGKYIPPTNNVEKLSYKEKEYRNTMVSNIRKLELEKKSYDNLAVIASSIRAMKGFKYDIKNPKKSKDEIINRVLHIEFPDVEFFYFKTLPDEVLMRNVLLSLDDNQLNILAYEKGVKTPEKSGKHGNIEFILRKLYPYKSNKIKYITNRTNNAQWSHDKRREQLENMTSDEIKAIALVMGIEISYDTNDTQLIKQILEDEEIVSKIGPIDDKAKEDTIKEIVKITKTPPSRYQLWTLDELKQRLEDLRDERQEGWTEKETARLYKKLSEIVDIFSTKYKDSKSWSTKKLRDELQAVAGYNWENHKPVGENYSFVTCMDYMEYTWIDGVVTGVWIKNPDATNKPDPIYIVDSIFIEEDGQKWYQANKEYFSLQCNLYKNKRSQNGNVFTCYTTDGEPVSFNVGYTLRSYKKSMEKYKVKISILENSHGKKVQRVFITQDDVLFSTEKSYEKSKYTSEQVGIQDLLNNNVTEDIEFSVMTKLSHTFLNIAPMKKDYGVISISTEGLKTINTDTPYMQILVRHLRTNTEQTNREFFTNAAQILAYLELDNAKTFRHNIENEYYLPDILAKLSPSEKFPEVFDDPSISEKYKDNVTSIINNKISNIVNNFASFEHRYTTGQRTATFITQNEFTRSIKTNKRLNACQNKDSVDGISDENIIYYKENNKIYCYSIDELFKQIVLEKNIINQYTGLPFNISFVKRFEEIYNMRLSDEGFLTEYFQKKYGFDMPSIVNKKINDNYIKQERPVLAPDLWDIIGRDIAELEDQLSNENPSEFEEIDENRDEERRETEYKMEERKSVDVPIVDACTYCDKHIVDDSIKSIVVHNEESRIIKFCSFKCFEHKNDWNKSQTIKVEKVKDNSIERSAEADKVLFPLMTKAKLLKLSKENDIKIPTNLNQMETASYLYKKIHKKSKTGIFTKKEAKKESKK